MKATLIKAWDTVLSSYWFIPSMMAAGAMVLAVGLTVVDARVGSAWLDAIPWLRANQPEAARTILATLAGSMITVAGVAFSITIAAVSYASNQFGPRIITSFMRDRGNQVTLGTFIATFLYCLTVLRTIWSPGEPTGEVGGVPVGPAFVPHLAMLGAFFFAVGSIGVLIYFVHHVPQSFHVGSVVARIGERLGRRLEELAGKADHADRILPSRAESEAFDALDPDAATRIVARESGYVHNVNWSGLLAKAVRHDVKVHWLAIPGRFIRKGEALALIWDDDGTSMDEGDGGFHGYVAFGSHRTEAQDPLFLVDELVEIAARALSPGVNDPFTANSCVDWLTAALLRLEGRVPLLGPGRDEDGQLRILTPPLDTSGMVERVFGQLRPYAAGDRIAATHLMSTLGTLYLAAGSGRERDLMLAQARLLMEASEETMSLSSDIGAMRKRYDVVRALHDEPKRRLELLRENPWLGTT